MRRRRALIISAGCRGFGIDMAMEQVNRLNVHSEVVCLIPFSFMRRIMISTAFGETFTVVRRDGPIPIA